MRTLILLLGLLLNSIVIERTDMFRPYYVDEK